MEEKGTSNVDKLAEKWNASVPAFVRAAKRKSWIIPVVYTQFWMAALSSLLAPYFPPLAASRGIPAWEYGFVFSVMKIAMLPGSILAEKLIDHISPKAGYLSGQGCFFICGMLFGTLYWVNDAHVFLVLSMIWGIILGAMFTTYNISLYALLATSFKDNGGMLIGVLECLVGIGTLVGAVIGGALIDLWTFPLPFFTFAFILIVSFPAMALLNVQSSDKQEEEVKELYQHPGANKKYSRLLCDPMFMINLFTVMLSWSIWSFNEPTLEPYLRQFKLTNTQVGSVFTLQYAGYSAGAILGGMSSRLKAERFFTFFGQSLSALSYLILGPAPFIPIQPNLFFIYLSQLFMGVGMALMFISPYLHALRDVVERAGYPPTIKTNAVVSSATYQFMIVGAVISSPLAGYLVETFGYRHGSMFLFGVLAVWSVVTGVVWLHFVFSREKIKSSELQQLLEDDYNGSPSNTEDPLRPSSTCRWYGAPQHGAGQ